MFLRRGRLHPRQGGCPTRAGRHCARNIMILREFQKQAAGDKPLHLYVVPTEKANHG
jgi:hypothetical protein